MVSPDALEKVSGMALHEAVGLYQVQNGQVDAVWTYFSTVSLAVAGYSVGSDKLKASFSRAAVMCGGYAVFCVGNFQSLSQRQDELAQLAAVVNACKDANVRMEPFRTSTIAIYYFAVVACVCAGVITAAYSGHRAKLKSSRFGTRGR